MEIKITRQDRGDSRRGYHNMNTIFEFSYSEDEYALEERREKEIIDHFLGKGVIFWQWYSYRENMKSDRTSRYVVNYGYDSGD